MLPGWCIGSFIKIIQNMKKIILSSAVLLMSSLIMDAQVPGEDTYIHTDIVGSEVRKELIIPQVNGYQVLKGDFHLHTDFSDGCVWPDYRVREAWYNGLDVIAITDHLEVLSHDEELDMKKFDYNASSRIAAEEAKYYDLLVVPGIEITRSKPFGHMNALFVKDSNKADVKDEMDALNAMVEQGAYIIWNHPGWPDDKCTMYPIHEELIAKGVIKGVEIFNDVESYPIAYDWVKEYGLHPFANSDAHGPVDSYYKGLRPMTLLFVNDRSLEGVKEALFAGRTIAFFAGNLMGAEEYVTAMAQECLESRMLNKMGDAAEYIVTNKSDIPFLIHVDGWEVPMLVGPRQTVKSRFGLNDTVTLKNCIIGKGKYVSIPMEKL